MLLKGLRRLHLPLDREYWIWSSGGENEVWFDIVKFIAAYINAVDYIQGFFKL